MAIVVQAPPQTEQRLLLSGVGWKSYLAILRALGERPIRATYDRGELELMTLSFQHERSSQLLARFVQVVSEEVNISILSAGSITLRRQKKKRGLEADKCFYLQNAPQVRDKDEIDLRRDPPPDLAVEVEITQSCLDRIGIYAALKVPEIWRFDGQRVQFLVLHADGAYQPSEHSLAFPFLRGDVLLSFLNKRHEMDENELVRSFREWVRQELSNS